MPSASDLPKVPLLYRYLGSHGFESLRDKRLKVAKFSEFNDPFDGMYVMDIATPAYCEALAAVTRHEADPATITKTMLQYGLDKKSARKRLVAIRPKAATLLLANFSKIINDLWNDRENAIDRCLRAICFSSATASPRDELLLWSHYAKMHTGMRIGFDTQSVRAGFSVQEVAYTNSRPRIRPTIDMELSDTKLREQFKRSVLTKSTAWTYEKEYRLLIQPEHCEKIQHAENKGLEFVAFSPTWVRRVDFGTRYPSNDIQTHIKALSQTYPHVEWRQSKYHKTEFKLEYQVIHPIPNEGQKT